MDATQWQSRLPTTIPVCNWHQKQISSIFSSWKTGRPSWLHGKKHSTSVFSVFVHVDLRSSFNKVWFSCCISLVVAHNRYLVFQMTQHLPCDVPYCKIKSLKLVCCGSIFKRCLAFLLAGGKILRRRLFCRHLLRVHYWYWHFMYYWIWFMQLACISILKIHCTPKRNQERKKERKKHVNRQQPG